MARELLSDTKRGKIEAIFLGKASNIGVAAADNRRL